MEFVAVLVACFALLFIFEVVLGGLPADFEAGEALPAATLRPGDFFGRLMPLSLAVIGLPMSMQHAWALWLVAAAAVLHLVVCRCMKAC